MLTEKQKQRVNEQYDEDFTLGENWSSELSSVVHHLRESIPYFLRATDVGADSIGDVVYDRTYKLYEIVDNLVLIMADCIRTERELNALAKSENGKKEE